MAWRERDPVLLVVDVQNDFCPGGTLPVPEGDRVVPVINALTRARGGRFRRVVATQDWHPAGHVSFASSHPQRKPFETVRLGDLEQTLWPDHCVAGTSGAEFHPLLDTRGFDLVLRKGSDPNLDSYSAFFENDRRTATGLAPYLEGLGLRSVYLAGLATDYCVYYSAVDALGLGFEVRLISDACRGIDSPPGSLRQRLQELQSAGVRMVRSQELEREA
jgi:nicotinamidase/pyrazinamidase